MNASFNLEKIKPYLLPIITAAVVILVVPLLVLPWFSDMQTNWSTINAQKTKLTALQTKSAALDQLKTSTNKTLLDQEVEPAIPSQADPSGVLGTLEQVAIASGATAKAVHFGQSSAAPAAASAGNTVTVSLSVQGNYASVFDFISHSETVSRVVSMSTMHIVPTGDANHTVIATFDAIAPYQPVPTNLGLTEDPLPERTKAKTDVLAVINGLHQASYAPTPDTAIAGRPSPF